MQYRSSVLTESSGIWRKEEDSKRAGEGEIHTKARKVTSQYFSEWKVERHLLIINHNVDGWRLQVIAH